MNENIEDKDRFHAWDLATGEKISNLENWHQQQIDNFAGQNAIPLETKQEIPTKKAPKEVFLEFAPEPMHMHEFIRCAAKDSFTVGNKYKVLSKREDGERLAVSYRVKTLNDKNEEVWIDEKYFIPSEQYLSYSSSAGPFGHKNEFDMLEETVEDIRSMATEKGVKPLEIEKASTPNMLRMSGVIDEDNVCFDDSEVKEEFVSAEDCLKRLSGLKKKVKKLDWDHKTNHWKFSDGPEVSYRLSDTDAGNPLIYDVTKCAAAISKVFGKNDVVDPDDILLVIQGHIPGQKLSWRGGKLAVGEAKTNITHNQVQAAYRNLQPLVSATIAEKTVAKLVANKLKKLF